MISENLQRKRDEFFSRERAQEPIEKLEKDCVVGMAQLKKCPTPITHRPKIGNEMEIMDEPYKVSSIEVTENGATIKLSKPNNLMFR